MNSGAVVYTDPSIHDGFMASIEREVVDRDLTTHPRVSLEEVESSIRSEHYFQAGDAANTDLAINTSIDVPASLDRLTFCVLVLKNGYTVTGEATCTYPGNYHMEYARKRARDRAIEKVWGLLAFRLADKLQG